MSCDVDEATEGLENEQRRKGWRMSCDVGEVTEVNEQSSFSNRSFASPKSQDLHLIHLASRPWFQYL